MKPRYILALVSFGPDSTDYANNIYPEQGRIESPQYDPDKDIRNGICGILWGKCRSRRWIENNEDLLCKVVQIDNDDEIVILDKYENLIKFRSGLIVHSGDISSCGQYIASQIPSLCGSIDMGFEDLAGYQTLSDQGMLAVSEGFRSSVVAEGDTLHAVSTADESESISDNDFSVSFSSGQGSRSVSMGNFSSSLVTAPHSRARNCGSNGKSLALDDCSVVMATGANSFSAGLGISSRGAVGENGVLMLTYHDGSRFRVAVGYSGEGIQANTEYEVDENGNFVEI